MSSVVADSTRKPYVSLSSAQDPGVLTNTSADHHGFPGAATTDLTNSLLSHNHEAFHIFFNDRGFHNHLVHQLLSLYSLDATPAQVQHAYDSNASYQLPLDEYDENAVSDMQRVRDHVFNHLIVNDGARQDADGNPERAGAQYANFLELFKRETTRCGGIQGLLEEWVFKGDAVAETIFGRLFAGILHPFIHLGFGLEYHQPAIVAEALAQACVHSDWMNPTISAVEKAVQSRKKANVAPVPLVDVLRSVRDHKTLLSEIKWQDTDRMRKLTTRAFDDVVQLCSQWYIPDTSGSTKNETTDGNSLDEEPSWEDIERYTAESIHAAMLFTASTAFHKNKSDDDDNNNSDNNSDNNSKSKETDKSWQDQKEPKFDFFLIHSTNASIFLTSFVKDRRVRDMLGKKAIIRLVEAKTVVDILLYVAGGGGSQPIMTVDDDAYIKIKTYETRVKQDKDKDKDQDSSPWRLIFNRVASWPDDDGHAVKLIRALANAQRELAPYGDEPWCVIKTDMWTNLAWVVVDSLLTGTSPWVRDGGFPEAWTEVPEWRDEIL